MGTDDVQNKAEEWKGAAKETIGDVTDNEDLQAEGEVEKDKAKAKEAVQDAKDNVKGVAENVKDAIHDKTS